MWCKATAAVFTLDAFLVEHGSYWFATDWPSTYSYDQSPAPLIANAELYTS